MKRKNTLQSDIIHVYLHFYENEINHDSILFENLGIKENKRIKM